MISESSFQISSEVVLMTEEVIIEKYKAGILPG